MNLRKLPLRSYRNYLSLSKLYVPINQIRKYVRITNIDPEK